MRREIEDQLSTRLKESEFRFIGRGERSTTEIYAAVKEKFNDLCDDNYICSHKAGTLQPEWKHVVRGDLQLLKGRSVEPSRWGYYIFR